MPDVGVASGAGGAAAAAEAPEWKKVSAKRFGIKDSMIPDEAWNVLHRLRSRGACASMSLPLLPYTRLKC